MTRIVLSEDCKVIAVDRRRRRGGVPPRLAHEIAGEPIDFGEVELLLLMPNGAPDETRIPVPASAIDPFEDAQTEQRYRLVLEPID